MATWGLHRSWRSFFRGVVLSCSANIQLSKLHSVLLSPVALEWVQTAQCSLILARYGHKDTVADNCIQLSQDIMCHKHMQIVCTTYANTSAAQILYHRRCCIPSCNIRSRSWLTSSSSARILWWSSAPAAASLASVVSSILRGAATAPTMRRAMKKAAMLILFMMAPAWLLQLGSSSTWQAKVCRLEKQLIHTTTEPLTSTDEEDIVTRHTYTRQQSPIHIDKTHLFDDWKTDPDV